MHLIINHYVNVNLVPTVEGASLPGISFSIKNLALHPVQWPGSKTPGWSFFRSSTVALS
jgi:hypothetical protein